MIGLSGWSRFNIWEHSGIVRDLYARRSRRQSEEMTCAAQAAELIANLVAPGDSLLDVGCGSGYFYHSLVARGIAVDYWGLDACADFIAMGREILPDYGLPAERLVFGRLEDLDAKVDHVLCMNVLSNLDNFHRPLERLLRSARKSVILRESVKDGASYSYVVDNYLDASEPLRVHVNTYDRADIAALAAELGFLIHFITDRRTGGEPELVIGHPHHWCFIVMQPYDKVV